MDLALANQFLLGAVAMGAAVAGLFFVRFWRKTGDRLFAVFAIAFWVMALNWTALAFTREDEIRTYLYVVRLMAFIVIAWGILDKNRATRRADVQPQVP